MNVQLVLPTFAADESFDLPQVTLEKHEAEGDVPRAEAGDILHCFRLLLGRSPNPEEISWHFSHIGQPLDKVVSGYLRSLEFSRRNLVRYNPYEMLALAEFPGFSLWADRNDLDLGCHILFSGTHEPVVTEAVRSILRPGMGLLDVGANIGYFTMLGAALVGHSGHVIAIEPNPSNAKLIEASRRHNGFEQVRIVQCAAGRGAGMLALHVEHSNGISSHLAGEMEQLLSSNTVAQMPIDDVVPGNIPIDLIKIDVEGAEYNALLGASQVIAGKRPIIISEFCPYFLPDISGIDGPGYLKWIISNRYEICVLGDTSPPTKDPNKIMDRFHPGGPDHIDIICYPYNGWARALGWRGNARSGVFSDKK